MSLLNSVMTTGASENGDSNLLSSVLSPVANLTGGSDASFSGSTLDILSDEASLLSGTRVLSGTPASADTATLPVGVASFTDDSHPFPFLNIEAGPSSMGYIVDGDVASGSYGTKSPIDLDIGPDSNHPAFVDAFLLQDQGTSVNVHTEQLTSTLLGDGGVGNIGGVGDLSHVLDLGQVTDLLGSSDHLLGGI